jgi:C-terminal processing protease CtpA/Prc
LGAAIFPLCSPSPSPFISLSIFISTSRFLLCCCCPLQAVSKKLARRKLDADPYKYYLRYTGGTTNEVLSDRAVVSQSGQRFEMCLKPERQVHMVCPSGTSFGLQLVALDVHEVGRVQVQAVVKGGIAELRGIEQGDEVLEINGTVVQGRLATAIRLLEDSAAATVRIRCHHGFDSSGFDIPVRPCSCFSP